MSFAPVLPATFTEKLKDQSKTEGEVVSLSCGLSKPAATVQWRKGSELLKPGEKYEMTQKGTSCLLQIKSLVVEDSGEYSCVVGDQTTSATLKVTGMNSCCFYKKSLTCVQSAHLYLTKC